MNIMLVSVTERTREIGMRLAIGALERDILMQFLVEAVVLRCSGGSARPALDGVGARADARARLPSSSTPGVIALAFAFSARRRRVRLLPGAYVRRSLDPIDALRHE